MAEEKILTLHPEGKQGVNIDKLKYEQMAEAILDVLQNHQPTSTEMTSLVKAQLADGFDGSIPWYMTTVKLDLEARNVIARFKKGKFLLFRLIKT